MSNITKIDHIGIAVQSIAEARVFYERGLGLTIDQVEDVREQGVKVAFISTGESNLELVEPLPTEEGGADSPIARFLEKRGEGIHHICLEVQDIGAALAQLVAEGFRVLDKTPRLGAHGKRIAFLHPASAHGVLIELAEKSQG